MAQAARLNLRMQKELKILTTDPPPGVSLNFSDKDDLSLTSFEAKIEGPEGTVYSKGIFTLKIQIPERYPFQPPNVTFLTPVYHPNIDNGGRICLDILNLPPKGAWQPSLNISTVLTSIGLLLSEPNPDDGLMAEASREYKYNKQVFDQKALSWTELYAYPGAKGRKEETGPNLVKEPIKEAETIEGLIENSEHFEGRKRKMRLLGHKLSLNSSWLEQKGNNENNKENLITEIKPNKEIFNQEVSEKLKDLSSLEKKGNNENNKEYSIPETKSKVKINHEGSKKLKDVSNLEKKGNNENKKENLIAETKSKVKFNHDGSKKLRDLSNLDLDTIIVSDSEESEEDEKTKRPFRARMKISGKRKC